jgi:hypothetical protein
MNGKAEVFINGNKIGNCDDLTYDAVFNHDEIFVNGMFINSKPRVVKQTIRMKMIDFDYIDFYEWAYGKLSFYEKLDMGMDKFFKSIYKLF